jgi:cation/acetate symporter
VHVLGRNLFSPGGMKMSPLEGVSLSMALILGIPGLPHILMRFFTVPDAVSARKSLFIGMSVVGVVYYLVFFIVAPASVAFLAQSFSASNGGIPGGSNMVALHLARFVGGDVMFGIVAAVAFATILAVVAGLTVAAASSISHDLYACVIRGGKSSEIEERRVFRLASGGVGILGIALGIAFEGQNILFLTGLVFSIAASACFPMLFMAMYWKRLTTAGAAVGGMVGLLLSIGLITLGPSVWVQVLGHAAPIVAINQPTIISAPAAFVVMIVVSLLGRSKDVEASRELR